MSERGSASIVVAGAVALAAMVAALSGDLSRVVSARARAQTAADAAALGAAQELVIPAGRAPDDVARDFAERNGARLVACRCEPGTTEAVATVEIEVDLPLLGQSRIIHAAARAVIAALPGIEGLQPFFVARLMCLFEAVDGLWIVSGFRTSAEQAELHEANPDLAAPPGSSNHELGLAADLGYPTDAAEGAAHAHAAGCGLEFPISYEPWHVEPIGV